MRVYCYLEGSGTWSQTIRDQRKQRLVVLLVSNQLLNLVAHEYVYLGKKQKILINEINLVPSSQVI